MLRVSFCSVGKKEESRVEMGGGGEGHGGSGGGGEGHGGRRRA